MLLDGRRDKISKFQSAEIEGKEHMSKLYMKPIHCQKYGGPTPHLNACPTQGNEYYNCGKMNHFAKFCSGKARKGHKSGQSRTQNFLSLRQHTEVKQLAPRSPKLMMSTSIPFVAVKNPRPHATIKVIGHFFDIIVDTGASINVIDLETFLHMKGAHSLEIRAKAFSTIHQS